MKNYSCFLTLLIPLFAVNIYAQAPALRNDTLSRHGAWATLEIENGDSTFLMSLYPARLVAPRKFKDIEEQRQFRRYIWAAKRVYPYALQAVELYQQMEDETQDMNRRQRRRYFRHENNELKEDMTETMKNLSKTEGKVLVKMIEKELEMPFYDVIRHTRGSTTAAYWNTLGKFWGYDLKEGYQQGADPLLDEVFIDYDLGTPCADRRVSS